MATTTGQDSTGTGVKGQLLSERMREWCKETFCYCYMSKKNQKSDPGDIRHQHPTPADTESIDSPEGRQDTSPQHSTQGDNLLHTNGEENHHTHETKSTFSPSHKFVRFANGNNGHTEQECSHYSPDQELTLSNPSSPNQERHFSNPTSPLRPAYERRQSFRLDYQSSHESLLDGATTDLAALEARLTELLGFGFFQTVHENEEEESDEEQSLQGSQQLFNREWQHVEFKLQLTEEQLKAKIQVLEEKTKEIQLKLSLKYTHGNLPYDIVLGNYESIKRRRALFMSEPMYTHPGGYRFRVEISPGGVGMAEDTHLSVDVLSIKGDYDPLLKFPVKFTITLQLLNQYNDQRHHQRKIECMYQESGNKNEIGSEFEYILDERLCWNEEKETQFLLNNVLRFRLTKVVFSPI